MADTPTDRGPVGGAGVWEQFTVRDGLPDMKIECGCAGADGTLWFGTHNRGLVRYDGEDFVSFGRHEGLGCDRVFSITEDAAADLWLGTGHGVWHFSGGTFEPLDAGGDMGFLWGACLGHDGSVWLGAERRPGRPAAVCRVRNGEVTVHEVEGPVQTQGESIRCLVCASDGSVWGGGDAIYRCQAGDTAFETVFDHEEVGAVYALELCGDGVILASTDKGVWEIGPGGIRLYAVAWINDSSVNTYFIAFCLLDDGRQGALTHDGDLYLIEKNRPRKAASLHAAVQGCTRDGAGRLWVATFGMGIYCYEPSRLLVYGVEEGVPDPAVNCLALDGERLLVGTRQGMTTYGTDGVCADERFAGFAELDISALYAADGECWVGLRNGFLARLQAGSAAFDVVAEHADRVRVNGIVAAADGVWFSFASGKGLGYCRDGETVYLDEASMSRYPVWVGALAADASGALWVGSADDKLWDGLCRCVGGVPGAPLGLGGRSVTALHTADGVLWVGTSAGLLRVEDGQVREVAAGAIDEIIRCVYCDGEGTVWIGTEGGGVYCHDGRVTQNLQVSHRPRCNFVNAIAQGAEGTLFFATEGGLVAYSRRRLVPQVDIRSIVADDTYGPGTEAVFPTTVGCIEVRFAGRSPQDHADRLVYRFCLETAEGETKDEDWHWTREPFAVWGRLQPGRYRVAVQAVDRDLNYSAICRRGIQVVEDPLIAADSEALSEGQAHGSFVGESQALYQVKKELKEVAWTNMTVLILGETGTGKGIAARSIHRMSTRGDSPFIYINCGAIPNGLVDSELFGHEKGAFTGASTRKPGKFELADGGTIFLDEIGDLPLASQARLLRVVQEKRIERVGGTRTLELDVRVIAATNRDLKEAVRQKRFRQDLYYRLNVFPVYIPPLRERIDDIPLLCSHFAGQFALHLNKEVPTLGRSTMDLFLNYAWPGNVRELEHTIQRAVLLARDGVMRPEDTGLLGIQVESGDMLDTDSLPIIPLDEVERGYIRRVLQHTGGVIQGEKGAARLLGLKPTTLRSRLERLGIDHRDYKKRNKAGP